MVQVLSTGRHAWRTAARKITGRHFAGLHEAKPCVHVGKPNHALMLGWLAVDASALWGQAAPINFLNAVPKDEP
jgi:hypothetical protein